MASLIALIKGGVSKALKIITPEPLQLSNGKIVRPAISIMWIVIPVLTFITLWSVSMTRFRLDMLIRRSEQFFVIVNRMIPPNFAYFDNILTPMIATILMSLVGTIIGAILALPFAYASSELNQSKIGKFVVRGFFSIARTLPVLVLAVLMMIVFGAGAFAGTAAIAVFTFTIMVKMFFELIDTADMGPFEAILSSGANRIQAFWTAIMPQLWGQYYSLTLYNLEMNIRNAAILGYVGAGGIGIVLSERLAWRVYPDVGLILLVLMVTVLVIESVSREIRRRLL
ncbi:MAG: phosphonate ABC transporter, permease protein PhnE [Erysipelotrichaceae bacterium]|nr:phosphonate ABC transporter, permease protein PhnE [Erysipelotrichaceae bacterium]